MSSRRFGPAYAVVAGALLSTLPANSQSPLATVHFHLHRDYLIVVPVTLNGSGPFEFLVDTGCSTTTIDPALDRQLKPPEIGRATVALLSDVRRNRKVRLDHFRIGPFDMQSLPVLVDRLDNETALAPGIRGILGEDILRQFDLLIDYDNRTLSFNQPAPQGERLLFQHAGAHHGLHTFNRIMVKAAFPSASGTEAVLQLDTAAWVAELFPASHVVLPAAQTRSALSGPVDYTLPQFFKTDLLIGSRTYRNVTVSVRRSEVASDAVGLLPTALFSNIFISHSGGFIILNPRPTRQPMRHNTLELAALAGN